MQLQYDLDIAQNRLGKRPEREVPPFIDGNKRTEIACAELFLQQNGIAFSAKNAELEKFTLLLASSKKAF